VQGEKNFICFLLILDFDPKFVLVKLKIEDVGPGVKSKASTKIIEVIFQFSPSVGGA
jgi:hypothetical protein